MAFSPDQYLPFTRRYVTVDGARMHCIDEGSGPAVMLLHGNPTWCFFYRELVKKLSPHFRVIVPDYLGCGLSDRTPHKKYRAIERSFHLETLLKELGVNEFSLVMHDWGGAIGTALATRHVDKVKALCYLNTTLTEVDSLPGFIKRAASPLIGNLLTQRTNHFLNLLVRFGVSKSLPADIRAGYLYPYRTKEQRQAVWDFVADIPFDSFHPSAGDLLKLSQDLPKFAKTPVKIIWGLKDPCFHREMLRRVAAHFPHADVVEITDASHLLIEDATDRVVSEATAFLKSEVLARSKGPVANALPLEGGVLPVALRQATISAVLPRLIADYAAKRPTQDAVITASASNGEMKLQSMRFGALKERIFQYERGLAALGLEKGDRVLFLVTPGAEFLTLTNAVMARGAVPVFIDPGIGLKAMVNCIETTKAAAFIGSAKGSLLRILKRKLFRSMKFTLLAHDVFLPGLTTLSFLKRFSAVPPIPVACAPEDTALIAFTSGATGNPKGVVFTQAMLQAQLEIFRDQFGLVAGGRDLPLLPIFSIFSVALGLTAIFPRMNPARPLELDPAEITTIINTLGVSSSFGSPTLWNKISEYCARASLTLPTFKSVFMAGAPVSAVTLQRVQAVLPQGEVYTPYGATEALPTTLISAAEILRTPDRRAVSGELGTLVGKAVRGVDLIVAKLSNEPIPSFASVVRCGVGEIGEVLVRGKNISREYFGRADANELSKVSDGDTVWHRIGDMGYLDETGNLWFCGRKAHVVRLSSGQMVYSDPVELVFNKHPRVRRSALISVKTSSGSEVEAAIAVELSAMDYPETQDLRNKLAQEILTFAHADPITAPIGKVFFHSSFPVDGRHNAKIFRDRLSRWADGQKSYPRVA